MAILDTEQQKQVADAIAAVEKTTDAELVAVLARRSDGYLYIPMLWAALFALMTPAVLMFLPFWLEASTVFLLQFIVFIVIGLVFSVPAIAIRLIPKSVRYWRASNMARRQFLENNLHHTKDETGVLIFVSEAERYVEIIADRGIDRHVDQQVWQAMVDRFTASVKKGETLNGFLDCIKSCGELLQQHAPATHARNELPNHLIVLD